MDAQRPLGVVRDGFHTGYEGVSTKGTRGFPHKVLNANTSCLVQTLVEAQDPSVPLCTCFFDLLDNPTPTFAECIQDIHAAGLVPNGKGGSSLSMDVVGAAPCGLLITRAPLLERLATKVSFH